MAVPTTTDNPAKALHASGNTPHVRGSLSGLCVLAPFAIIAIIVMVWWWKEYNSRRAANYYKALARIYPEIEEKDRIGFRRAWKRKQKELDLEAAREAERREAEGGGEGETQGEGGTVDGGESSSRKSVSADGETVDKGEV